MLGRKVFVMVVAIFLVLLVSLPAYAQVTWHFSGDITYVNPANPWSFDLNTSVSGTAVFNTGLYSPDWWYEVGYDGGSLEVNIGSLMFGNNDQRSWAPYLLLDPSENLLDIDLEEEFLYQGTLYQFQYVPNPLVDVDEFTIRGPGEIDYVRGTFDFNPVPIPGAVWLLASGLVGLMGLRKRSRTS